MIEIDITEEQIERAKKLYDFEVLNNSVTKGEGNIIGSIGEVIVYDYYKKTEKVSYVGSKDYDMLINGFKVEVKSKKQNVKPANHHSHNIFAYNTKQKCDYYCFVVILSTQKKGWIVGFIEKNRFLKESTFRKKGEIDPTVPGKWTFKADCYTIKITELDKF